MNDQELADKLRALLVIQRGQFEAPDGTILYYLSGATCGGIPVQEIVRDWRVAGAMIEKCSCSILQNERSIWLAKAWATDESPRCEIADSASSPARAINEACAAALNA